MNHDSDRGVEIEWEKYDREARVFADQRAVVRRLLRHPLFEPDQVLRSDGDPIAVEGEFPVTALKFCVFERDDTSAAKALPYDGEQKRQYVQEYLREDDSDE